MKKFIIPLLLMSVLPITALAQFPVPATSSTVIDTSTWQQIFAPVIQGLALAIGTLLTALITWGIRWVNQRLKLNVKEMDAANRDALDASLTTAAGQVLNALGNKLPGTIDVKDERVAAAINTVMRSAPDAIRYFGLDKKPDIIAQRIVAKLPVIAATPTPPPTN